MIFSYLYITISILATSALSLTGIIFLFFKIEKLKKITIFLVSLSAGTLLGASFLHLLPEIIKEDGNSKNIWLLLLFGIILFFILEKIIRWRHCHEPTCEDHPHSLGLMNLVGDGLHNFIDGIIIAGAYLTSVEVGITTTIAIIFHEIPQEMADFGVLIYAGFKKKKALLLNFLLSLTAIAGGLLVILLEQKIKNLTEIIIPITAGSFIYIATADLLPELKKEASLKKSFHQLLFILLGIGIMLIAK